MKILQRTFYSFLTVIDAQPCPTLCDPKDWGPPSSSVHGILQARILEWVAVPFSRRFSQPRDQTQVSLMAGIFFIVWVTREALSWQYTDLNAWRAKQLSPLKIPKEKRRTALQFPWHMLTHEQRYHTLGEGSYGQFDIGHENTDFLNDSEKRGMFIPEDMNQDQSETARSSHQCVTTKKKKKKKSGNS